MLDREKLPQIPKDQTDEFIKFAKSQGVSHAYTDRPLRGLKPIQSHVNRSKVDGMKKTAPKVWQSLIVSNDGHILDGHHRFVAQKELDPTKSAKCLVFDCPITDLVRLGHEFDGSFVKSVHEGASYKELALLIWC